MIKLDEVALEVAREKVNLQIISAQQKGAKLDSNDTTETAITAYFARLEADGLMEIRNCDLYVDENYPVTIIRERPKP